MFDRSFDGASFDAHEGQMLCCHAVPLSNDCQTVADTRRVVGSCWLCGAHRAHREHLAPLATDYWDASHSFIEQRIVALAGIFKK